MNPRILFCLLLWLPVLSTHLWATESDDDQPGSKGAPNDTAYIVYDVETRVPPAPREQPVAGEGQILSGHSQGIDRLALSPDSRQLLSVSSDVFGGDQVTAILWDVRSGRELRRFKIHGRMVVAVTFSADGRQVRSADADGKVRSCDLASGRETMEGVLPLHADEMRAKFEGVAFSADRKRAFASMSFWGGRENFSETNACIRAFDIRNGQEVFQLEQLTGSIAGLQLSADGKRLMAAGENTVLCIWDAQTGRLLSRARTEPFDLIQFSGSGRFAVVDTRQDVAFGNNFETVEIIPIQENSRAAQGGRRNPQTFSDEALPARDPAANQPQFISQGRILRVVDVSTGREVRRIDRNSNENYTVAISPDGKRVATADETAILVWDISSGAKTNQFQVDRGTGNLMFSPDGRLLVSTTQYTALRLLKVSE